MHRLNALYEWLAVFPIAFALVCCRSFTSKLRYIVSQNVQQFCSTELIFFVFFLQQKL